MFIKSLTLYGAFRIFSVIAGLLQIFIINKKFGVGGYGQISLIYAYAAYLNIFALQWLSKITARLSNEIDFNKALLSLHIFIGIFFLVLSLLLNRLVEYASLLALIALIDSLKEHILEYFRSNLKVKEYGLLNFIYSLVGIVYLLLILKIEVAPVKFIIFLYLVYSLVIIFFLKKYKLFTISYKNISKINMFYIKYGYSISISNSISQFAFSGVRIFIGNKFGNEVLGAFSIIYDLLQRSIVSYMQIINSATFPIMRNNWDNKKLIKLEKYARLNFSLLMYLPMAGILTVLILYKYILSFLEININSIGFDTRLMIAVVGLGIIFNRIKSFHVDYFLLFLYKSHAIFKITALSMFLLLLLIVFFINSDNVIYINISVTFSYLLSLLITTKYIKVVLAEENVSEKFNIVQNKEVYLFFLFFILICIGASTNIDSLIVGFLLVLLILVLSVSEIYSNYLALKKVESYED